ncbi:MAG: sugar/nucleoside kinase (ribokinase family) [Paracoccaceae bacterium]
MIALSPGPVVVIGDVMRDVLVRPDGPLIHGADRRAQILHAPGGSGANQAVWLAAAGVPVRFAARVGAADHAAIAGDMRAVGVDARLGADPDAPTGAIVALIDPGGERSFYTSRGANDRLCPADLPPDLLDGAGLLHVSGYALVEEGPRAAVAALIALAHARGIPVSVDPGSASFLAEIGAERFLNATAGAALCCLNLDEAAALGGLGPLAARYRTLVIKNGGGPAQVRIGGEQVAQASPALTPVIDTTGAGDAFLAGFLAALRKGAGVDDCLAAAHAMAARAVGRIGARPG